MFVSKEQAFKLADPSYWCEGGKLTPSGARDPVTVSPRSGFYVTSMSKRLEKPIAKYLRLAFLIPVESLGVIDETGEVFNCF